jgi:hypothetical protein
MAHHETPTRASLLLGALAVAGTVAASTGTAEASPDKGAEFGVRRHRGMSFKRFGLLADAGVPDGANGAIVYRLFPSLGIHMGGGYNAVSPGIRGGVTFAPFSTFVRPSVSFDVGHYFEGDANPIAQKLMGDPSYSSPLLDHVGYDYMNAHVGLEFGGDNARIYFRGGMSRITGAVHGINEAAGEDATVSVTQSPDVEMITVSARIGLVVYIAE